MYFPGEGLQLHPLSTFKKANHMHGACERQEPECDAGGPAPPARRDGARWPCSARAGSSPGSTASTSAAARRRGSAAWRTPPRSRPTAARPTCSASRATSRSPARRSGPSRRSPPTGVRTTGFAGGVHYLQYSFAPRLYIFNAFLQSLIGLHDFGRIADDDRAPRAVRGGRARGARGDPALGRRRLVALLLPRRRGDRATTTSCCASSSQSMCTRRLGRALLRVRRPLPRLPGRPARADLHRARS